MPSIKPVIAVRLEQPLYDKIAALARAQGRSLSNFVEQIVKGEMEKPAKGKRA